MKLQVGRGSTLEALGVHHLIVLPLQVVEHVLDVVGLCDVARLAQTLKRLCA